MKKNRCMRLIGLAFLLFLGDGEFSTVCAQINEPILRIEAGVHNASIIGIAIDQSNHLLVTASEDKTARVWNISSHGEPLRILRPPIGEGDSGQIVAVALSPDSGTVACGGRTGSLEQADACLYLFDRTTGALIRRLGGLTGYVQHLTYTPDGRFLAVAMGKSGMRLYRLPDYTLVAEDVEYGDLCYWAESDPTGSRLATGGWDGFIRLYDLTVLTGQDASSSHRAIAPVSKIRPPGGPRPWGLAFSPDGTRLAVGFYWSSEVDVLEVKGNTLNYAYSPDTNGVDKRGADLRTVVWSSDGGFLYAAGSHRFKAFHQVRRWTDGGRGRYHDLPTGAVLPIFHILPLRAGGIAFCSRDGSFGVTNDRGEAISLAPKAVPIFRDNYEGFLLSPDGSGIQFGYEKGGKPLGIFSVSERRLWDASLNLFAGLKARFTFDAPITDGLGVSDWKSSLSPKLNGNPLPLKNETSFSLAIRPDRSGFLLGTVWSLYHFDASGKEIWRIKTPGAAWGVNTSGQIAVAALSDGTIRWYRLSDGKELLAFFPHPDRKRWVLWTPSGYYDASPGGENFIGWHVNYGKDREADFFPASRFRSVYLRPDVIDKILATADEAEAVRLANLESGRKEAETISIREKLPPVLSILYPLDGSEISSDTVIIRFSARSQEPITGTKILLDGRPVSPPNAIKFSAEGGEFTVATPQRDCEISLLAENRHAMSEPATVHLRWRGAPPMEEPQLKPRLYVLAVGVSQYQKPDMRLLLAAKDALDFAGAWTDQKGKLYSGVEVRALTDAQATKANILEGLQWLEKQVRSNDVAVLFFAGHGLDDNEGLFYFLPFEAEPTNLKGTGLPQTDIVATVSVIAGKVLVFMDACHSGNLMGKTRRRGLLDVSTVINELAAAENGAIVFSSSTGRQYSLENTDWGNGAFTKGLVEGIGGKADFRRTGRITVNMLDLYVSERVKELTEGQQTPTTVKPPNVPDFPVVVLVK
jgi:WD40 repeat protein